MSAISKKTAGIKDVFLLFEITGCPDLELAIVIGSYVDVVRIKTLSSEYPEYVCEFNLN